jgi:hypothetical protein
VACTLGLVVLGLASPSASGALTFTVAPETAGPGDTVTWTVQDQPGRYVAIAFSQVPRGLRYDGLPLRLGADAQVLTFGITDADGRFQAFVRLPADVREDVFYFQAGTAADAGLSTALTVSGLARLRVVRDPEASALAALNRHRQRAGLAPVVLDPVLSAGAAAHARYLLLNGIQGPGQHEENPGLPGYSTLGDATARRSNISQGPFGTVEALEGLLAVPYHRLPMLEPRLDRVGYGRASTTEAGFTFNVHVLDVGSRGGVPGSDPVLFPGPGQTEIPLFSPVEDPDPVPAGAPRPTGYTVTVQFPDSPTPVRQVSASLSGPGAQTIPVHLSTPEEPARPDIPQGNAVFMIPAAPLQPGTSYLAAVDALVNGQPQSLRWSFVTLPPQSLRDVPTTSADAFGADGIRLEAPLPVEFFNEQVATLEGTVTTGRVVAAGFRPAGSTGFFLLRTPQSRVTQGRFRLDLVFRPEEVGRYEMLLFLSDDGVSFRTGFAPPVLVEVF